MTAVEDLSPELVRLETLLLALAEDAMALSQLDGYLCGIAISPDAIEPDEWLPDIHRASPADAAAVGIDLDELSALAVARYHAIAAELAENHYQPLYDIDEDDEIIWEIWMDGFEGAMGLRLDAWEKLLQSRQESQAQEAAFGFMSLLALSDPDAPEPIDPLALEDRREAPLLIPRLAGVLYRAHRLAAPQTPLRSVSVGRNDPCPCGSGLKYKRCHGA